MRRTNLIQRAGVSCVKDCRTLKLNTLTVIDDDVPRDDQDKKMDFDAKEIIRELHDQGDDGRLFKMSRF